MPRSQQRETEKPLAEELRAYVRRDGWIHSPLIIESPPWRSQIEEINKRFTYKKQKAAQLWEEKQYTSYVFQHERPYRFDLLEKVLTVGAPMADEEIALLVRKVWIDSENVHQNQAGWRRIWQSLKDPKQAMDRDDIAALADQPDPLRVFRGVQSSKHDRLSLSWTTDRGTAVWFGQRFTNRIDAPLLISGNIAKKYIFAYFIGRKESEVVALPKFIKGRTETAI